MESSKKDWFEFLLDLDLLDKHLVQPYPDPNSCSLIIQFLYHANLTEQLYNSPIVSNGQLVDKVNGGLPVPPAKIVQNEAPIEPKTKRIRVLRLLAVKAAALSDWDLLLFEKEIPLAVMSDLLQIFIKISLNNNEKPHCELDLNELDIQSLFALQLLHRWWLRLAINSKYPIKPQKSVPISVPGFVNPVQHMKEANENVLKLLAVNIDDSIRILETFLTDLNTTNKILKPTSACFSNINSETGEYDLVWSNGIEMDLAELQLLIKYDLAQYYFLNENYLKCYNLLKNSNECDGLNGYSAKYCTNFMSILSVCEMLFNQNSPKTSYEYSKDLILNKIGESKKNGYKDLFNILVEDNKKCELSMEYRMNLESKLTSNADLYDQICSCNQVRFAFDDLFMYKNYDLSKLAHLATAINATWPGLRDTLKTKFKIFLKINFKRFSKQCLAELSEKNKDFEFLKVLIKSEEVIGGADQEMTPMSPVDTQSKMTFSSDSVSEYIQLSIKTTDPFVLKHAISSYNNQQQDLTNRIKNYWSNEWNLNTFITTPHQLQQIQTNLNKLTSINNVDFIVISLAKIYRLQKVHKYDAALRLIQGLEDAVRDNQYLNKFILYEILTVNNLKKAMYDDNLEQLKASGIYEQLYSQCKNFLYSLKSDPDVNPESVQVALAFILNTDDYKFVLNLDQTKKHGHHVQSGYIEFCKKLVKFSIATQEEKGASRKNARDLWDCVLDIFTDTVQTKRGASSALQADYSQQIQPLMGTAITRESQTACLTRESFHKFIKLIKNKYLVNILFSLITTLYNICETSCHIEITSEYRQLWPSTITLNTSLNSNYLNDILSIFVKKSYKLDSFNTTWLRTIGDIYAAQLSYSNAIKFYIQVIINETRFFFINHPTQINRIFNEKLLKLMIKSCLNLNKFLQVTVLCQYLPVIDYQLAFKCLQEKYSYDTIDDIYKYIWDVTLYEYAIYVMQQRNYPDKRDLLVRLCSHISSNESNPKDIRQRMIDVKRTAFFLNLIKYYLV